MTPSAPALPRAVAGKAREVLAKARPGALEGRRSLPIRGSADDIRRRWDDPAGSAAVLDGIPVADAGLEVGEPDHEWGRTTSVRLRLSAPVPGAAAQALAGKAVRRLKALVETGEVPTTAHNPSGRSDAGEEAS
jgi:hypothetical protein